MDNILSYIINNLGNRKTAFDYLNRYEKAKTDLGTYPCFSQLSSSKRLADLGVRVRPIGGYSLYYIFRNNKVYILRVVSTLMDIESEEFIFKLNSTIEFV